MQSRMDKYNDITSGVKSRTEKNRDLYETVRNSSLTEFDINSNVSVINDSNVVSVSKIKQILDDRYKDNAPKRKSIEVPIYEDEVEEEISYDTKEYDINAIISKAKQGKNIDYNKERLKKIRDAQYEILNNLDLELKKIEEPTINHKKKKEEEDLMNLINTITKIEEMNKEKYSKEVSGALDLLELGEEEDSTVEREIKQEINKGKDLDESSDFDITIEKTFIDEESKEYPIVDENEKIDEPEEEKEEDESEVNLNTIENTIDTTLSKLNIDMNSYEDFKDVASKDSSSIIIKFIIFIVIICLIAGAIYILNNLLDLGLF